MILFLLSENSSNVNFLRMIYFKMSCFIIIFVSKKVENSNAEYGNQYAVESVESGSLVI